MQSFEIKEICYYAVNWLIRLMDSRGRFKYKYHLDYPEESIKGYNVLRHAGCCYALLEYSNYFKDSIVRDCAYKGIDFLLENYVNKNIDGEVVVIEDNTIKAGGIGLTILMLLKQKSEVYSILAEELGDYLLSIQEKKSGGLNFHIKKTTTDFIKKDSSDFYDGEVALALLQLYWLTKRKKYEKAALKLIDYKYKGRKKDNGWTRDHWMVQAIELIPKPTNPYLHFAQESIKHIMDDSMDMYIGDAFGSAGCRVEALMSYYNILTQGINVYKTSKKVSELKIERDMVLRKAEKFMKLIAVGQIKWGLSKGGWTENFNSKILRMDFMQHITCGFIKYLRYKSSDN